MVQPALSKRAWGHEDKMALITTAEKYDVLWNTAYPFYRELNQRKNALADIKECLNNKFCTDEINAQWRNLKDVFYKKKTIIEQKMQTGELPKEPVWRYYQPLKFLLKCEDQRKDLMRKRHTGNFQIEQMQQLRLKRQRQILNHSLGLPDNELSPNQTYHSSTDSLSQFSGSACKLEDYDDYEKFNGNQTSKSERPLKCNLDLEHNFQPKSTNLDMDQLALSLKRKKVEETVKKEIDSPLYMCDREKLAQLEGLDQDLDSEYGSINSTNQADGFDEEDVEDDDRLACDRDKIIPTSMSTTDALLAVATAASSSTKSLKSSSRQLKHACNLSPTPSTDMSVSQKAPFSLGSINLDSGLVSEPRDRTSQQRSSVSLRSQFGAKQSLKVIKTNGTNNLKKFETACPSTNSPKIAGGTHATATVTASLSKNMGQEEKDADANKFKFFGNYVESALLDLNQQSPSIARLLVQSIYQTIADHQLQLTE